MQLPWRPMIPFIGRPGPAIVTSLTEREADCLHNLAMGKRVLEIGAAYGFSTVLMADVADSVVSVDHHKDVHGSLPAYLGHLETYGVQSKVTPVIADSRRALPKLRAQFDMAFIDGDHSYDGIKYDVLQCEGGLLSRRPAILALHDYHEDTCPGVTKFINDHFGPTQIHRLVDTLYVVEL